MAEQAVLEGTARANAPSPPLPQQRVAALLGELAPARRAAIEPALAELLSAMPPDPRGPVWRTLADGLANDLLADFDVSREQIQDMLRLLKIKDRRMVEVFQAFYQRLRQAPLSSYDGLDAAFQRFDTRDLARQFLRQFLLQLFVVVVNRRIQLLYQVYLVGRPFPAEALEDDRPVHFEPLEAAVTALLRRADIPGLIAWLGFAPDRAAVDGFLMALNKFNFDPYRINFRFTHHCNIQCAHCYNFSGPHQKAVRIETDKMLAIVEDMGRTGMPNMNLTGGEPFMYLDTVLALVAKAREVGVPIISMYTNGFFAKTEASGRKVLTRLKAAGFMQEGGAEQDHIKVSAGVYHQEFLSFDTVVNLIRAYRDVFGKNIKVDYEVLENKPEVQDEIRRLLNEKGVANQVDIIFRGITSIGRAAQFDPALTHVKAADHGPCGSIDEIVFDPDGSARPCCGMNFENDGIAIGDIDSADLPVLLKRLQNNPVLQFIARNPMGRIFDYLDETPRPEGYANICNLCEHALGNLTENQALKRALAPQQDYFPFWLTAERVKIG